VTGHSPEAGLDAVGVLNEPVRRALYRYVVTQRGDVSRHEAAAAVGVQRTLAAFHLDKLVGAGLLEASFRRLTDRTGPGAGRPAKLYRRASVDHTVSLPPRAYQMAAELLAEVVDEAGADATLHAAARRAGRALAERALSAFPAAEPGPGVPKASNGTNPSPTPTEAPPPPLPANSASAQGRALSTLAQRYWPDAAAGDSVRLKRSNGSSPPKDVQPPLRQLEALLTDSGFEPFRDGDTLRLHNCPFHALSRQFPPLICGMNHAFIQGIAEAFEAADLDVQLDPGPDRCCVAVRHVPDPSAVGDSKTHVD
jgi:predicted ArsR family transcriptional regulator